METSGQCGSSAFGVGSSLIQAVHTGSIPSEFGLKNETSLMLSDMKQEVDDELRCVTDVLH